MKKIIIFIIFFIFSWNIFAQNTEKIYETKKVVKKIDDIFKKDIKKEKIEDFLQKLEKIDKKNLNNFQLFYLEYLNSKAKNYLKENFLENNFLEFEKNIISENTKKIAENKILKLQNKIFIFNNFFSWKWDLQADFFYKNLKSKIKLNDFSYKYWNLNSLLKWKLDLFFEWKNWTLSWKWDFDWKIKDFETFFSLKNTKIENKNFENKEILEALFEIIWKSEKNIFLKSDFFENLNIFLETKKALFEAYKIDSWKYFLKPNLDFCNFLNNFFYLKNKNCSKKELKILEENFLKNYKFYLKEEKNKDIFYLEKNDDFSKIKAEIILWEKNIEKITFIKFFPKNKEKITFDYNFWKNFDFSLKSEKSDIILKSKIKDKLFFENIDFSIKSSFLNGFLKLENKVLKAKISWEKNIFLDLILDKNNFLKSWILNIDLKNFSANMTWKNYDFSWKINIKNNIFIIKNFILQKDFFKFDLDFFIKNKNYNWKLNWKLELSKNILNWFFSLKTDKNLDLEIKIKSIFEKNIDFFEIDKIKNYYNIKKILTFNNLSL